MHVGSLQLFKPPEDAGPDYVRDSYQAMLECTEVQPTFRKRPAFFGGLTNVAWSFDKDVELDYHLRRSALPNPGRVRDLLELTSRLHSGLLDRHRPLWEAHLVEGLEDGRYAVYTKFHHSLMDGVSAMRLLQRTFASDPADDEMRVPWSLAPRKRKASGETARSAGAGRAHRGVGVRLSALDVEAGARGAARTATDAALPGAAHHVQRAHRRGSTGGRTVLVAGPHQGGQGSRWGDDQRRGARHVFRCAARLSR